MKILLIINMVLLFIIVIKFVLCDVVKKADAVFHISKIGNSYETWLEFERDPKFLDNNKIIKVVIKKD